MPGKFEGAADKDLAEKLYGITQDGGETDSIGSVDELGWFGLIADHEEFGGKAYIVSEDSQGFFEYDEFDSISAARREWHKIEAEYSTYYTAFAGEF